LDLLLFGDSCFQNGVLQIPHPHLLQRPFVLQPLFDVAADVKVPPYGKTVRECLHALPNPRQGIYEQLAHWI
jgi:7,8-dihydro-6-hydroxymethylpterin-pyrophosphokinase